MVTRPDTAEKGNTAAIAVRSFVGLAILRNPNSHFEAMPRLLVR